MFDDADLRRAEFNEAINVTAAQLRSAANLEGIAGIDPEVLAGLNPRP